MQNNNPYKKISPSFVQVNQYLSKAAKSISDSQKILKISSEESFKATYDSMLKITLALMISSGVRPRSQVGHHIAMIKFSEKHSAVRPRILLDDLTKCVNEETG